MNLLTLRAAVAATLIAGQVPSCAADTGGMSMKGTVASAPVMATADYRFELTGPQRSDVGRSSVSIRLIHTTDNKPVVGAIIVESRADLSPIGMTTRTAPIKALPSATPGVYTFEIVNGAVWNKPAKWALTFAVKVKGEAQAVHGSVIVQLSP
jgi:hypothetical protein